MSVLKPKIEELGNTPSLALAGLDVNLQSGFKPSGNFQMQNLAPTVYGLEGLNPAADILWGPKVAPLAATSGEPVTQSPPGAQPAMQSKTPFFPENGSVHQGNINLSQNNPWLAYFPKPGSGKTATPLLMAKATEWENQQAKEDAGYFTVTPQMLQGLPQNSVYRNAFQAGQRLPLNQLPAFQKGLDEQQAQQELQGLLPQAEQAYAQIPDGNPNKPLIKFALDTAIKSGDPKQLQSALNYIKGTMQYVTPKAQTPAQQQIDINKAENLNVNTQVGQERIKYLKSQIAKNQAQVQKWLTGGSSGGGKGKTGALKSKLVTYLQKSYDQYLRQQQMSINNGSDPGDVLEFPAWVQGQNYTSGGRQLSGGQMWELYNQEALNGVDVAHVPPASAKKQPRLSDTYLQRTKIGSVHNAIIKAINERESRELIEDLIQRWNGTTKNAKHDLNYWVNEARKRK